MRAQLTRNVVPRFIGPMQRSVSHVAARGTRQIKSRTDRKRICWPVFLFFIALVVPWVIDLERCGCRSTGLCYL